MSRLLLPKSHTKNVRVFFTVCVTLYVFFVFGFQSVLRSYYQACIKPESNAADPLVWAAASMLALAVAIASVRLFVFAAPVLRTFQTKGKPCCARQPKSTYAPPVSESKLEGCGPPMPSRGFSTVWKLTLRRAFSPETVGTVFGQAESSPPGRQSRSIR